MYKGTSENKVTNYLKLNYTLHIRTQIIETLTIKIYLANSNKRNESGHWSAAVGIQNVWIPESKSIQNHPAILCKTTIHDSILFCT